MQQVSGAESYGTQTCLYFHVLFRMYHWSEFQELAECWKMEKDVEHGK